MMNKGFAGGGPQTFVSILLYIYISTHPDTATPFSTQKKTCFYDVWNKTFLYVKK